jgi:hypothetical protein
MTPYIAMTPYMMESLVLWGLVATTAMTAILQLSQGLGLSRMSLTFLLGSAFTGNRSLATVLGFVLYIIGGWLFAFLYFLFFTNIGIYTWWLGSILGLIHGLFLLVCVIPLLPFVHPRMASEHHGVTDVRQLEPPGFLATNYGYQTPLATLVAQAVYGGVLGACVQIQHAMTGLKYGSVGRGLEVLKTPEPGSARKRNFPRKTGRRLSTNRAMPNNKRETGSPDSLC